MGIERQVALAIPGPGLIQSVDPGRMVEPGGDEEPDVASGFRAFKNVLLDGNSIRTAPGRAGVLGNQVYAGGTSAKVAIYARKDADLFYGNLLVAVRQLRVTGTASATLAGYLLDATLSPFNPSHVGRIVYNSTDLAWTVVTGFVNQWTLELADDIFTSGEGYWIAARSQIVGMAPYVQDGLIALADGTLLGEMEDDERVEILTFQNRAFILSGTNRGGIVYKNSFRNIGMNECTDNNSLSVAVTGAGVLEGNYRWALCFTDPDTWKTGPPLIIENSGDWYTVVDKRMVIDLATIPTSATDTYSHLTLFRKKDEWADYYRVAEVSKDAAAQSGTSTSAGSKQLVDSGGPFSIDDVGLTARCTTSEQTARITKFIDANTVGLESDIFLGSESYVITDGTTTGAASPKLIDSGASFDSTVVDLKVMDQAGNVANIDGVDTPTQLDLSAHIFGSGEAYTISDGVTTSASLNQLIDSGAAFTSSDVGKRVHDEAGNWATVTGLEDANTLALSADIFSSGEGYWFESGRTTSDLLNSIVDSRASFDGGLVGRYVYNSALQHTDITVVASTTLTLSDDYFDWNGEGYTTEFSDNVADAVALASNVLIPDRDPPCGHTKMFVWRNRPHFYGGYELSILGSASVTSGSPVVTLSGVYTTGEWMIGARMFIAASGSTSVRPYEIRRILTSTTLELVADWGGDTISNGNGRIITHPNRVAFAFQSAGDCEMQHVYYVLDVREHDGDRLMHVGVVDDRVIALKRRGVFLLAITEVVDPVDSKAPYVDMRAISLGCSEGCVGPRAACQDAQGRLFWFAGDAGLLMYDGSVVRDLSESVKDWFRQLDSDLFYDAILIYEPNNNELILANVSLADGTESDLALGLNLETGIWREIVDFDVGAWSVVQVKV